MEGVTCDVCRSDMNYPVCFQLNPCSHRACVKCFHELVPSRIFDRCPCPGCREWVSSSTLLEMKGTTTTTSTSVERTDTLPTESVASDDTMRSNPSVEYPPKNPARTSLREVQEVPHFQPDEQMDPFRHWAIQKPNLYTGFLYVAYRFSEDEASFYKSNFRAFDSDVFMDDESTDEMVKIFARILHPLLLRTDPPSGFWEEGEQLRAQNPKESHNPNFPTRADLRHRQDRQHLAMRCMYALSSGRVLTRAEQEEKFGKGCRNDENLEARGEMGPRRATKRLAKELLRAYQNSCVERREETPGKPSSPPPSSIVHDLRCYQDEGSKDQTPDAIEGSETPGSYSNDRKTQPSENDSGGPKGTNMMGWNDFYRNENDNETTPPIVPAILWVLSAVFILSK